MKKNDIIVKLQEVKARSAWNNGVIEYACMILEDIDGDDFSEKALLNGAENWREYSYGGSALICDFDIAKTLCTASELKRTKNGSRRPNSRENWLDVQARALYQAYRLIHDVTRA